MKEKIAAIFIKNLSYDLQDLNYKNTLNEIITLFEKHRRSDLIKYHKWLESATEPEDNISADWMIERNIDIYLGNVD